MNNEVAILIPAYNPDDKLISLVEELSGIYTHIVVVNDGSVNCTRVFALLSSKCIVLAHEVNKGKGAALKTGFEWILKNRKNLMGVVTADADGQHKVSDISHVAVQIKRNTQGLVLGVRAFKGKVPIRSRFGNSCTRVFFYMMTGLKVSDTQTGLRGIPMGLLPSMLTIPGERYEYEMQMLVAARHHSQAPIQVDIETVYLEGNASSHFNPIKDSIKIWGALISSRFHKS